ncbi:MAG: hypothetical protein JO215_12405, partial [Ktedonobacteraceae bacterium]|nr:hypothetical protein [Ktedonobacteraceae bacterium]
GYGIRDWPVTGAPTGALPSYSDLLNFFEQQRLIEHIDLVHLSIRLLIPPGSAILDTPDSTAWLGELDAAAYTYRWRHSDPRMDALQQQVSVCVEQAQGCESDPVEVFFSVKALALAARNENFSVEQAVQHYGQRKVLPHLSESWFCCAEPTRSQLTV